jgi:hypothetical protein
MQLADAYNEEQAENIRLRSELRDLRYAVGKYEDAIETALEKYDEGASADEIKQTLSDALMQP